MKACKYLSSNYFNFMISMTFHPSYARPFDHGYLTKMDIELQIWNRLFGAACLKINPADHNLVLTESPFNFESIQNDINEVVFEEYEFPNYLRRVPSWFSAYEFSRNPPQGVQNTDCCTVVDSGFSYTHIMPFIDLKCQKHAVSILSNSFIQDDTSTNIY